MDLEALVFILLEDWNLDSLLSGNLAAIVGVGILGVALVASLFAWLKGRRTFPIFLWIAALVATALLVIPHSWIEDNLPSIWEWIGSNSQALVLALEIAILVGGALCVFGMIRLAKPSSWWAQRRYDGFKYQAAIDRYGWSRVRAR